VEASVAPDGTSLVLARRGDEWVVRSGGAVLMSSRQHGSEEALAALALAKAVHRRSVFLGGLGLGFTLRAALDRLPTQARVVVVELSPALLDWNRRLVGQLAGRPLDDPRVRAQVGDAAVRLRGARDAYDAILLDLDNGPTALVQGSNRWLYGPAGVAACRQALRPGGRLAVWSARGDDGYLERLQRAGLDAEARSVPARGQRGLRHVIFLAVKGTEPAGPPRRPPGPRAPAHRGPRGG
jgi:spermidine synthase